MSEEILICLLIIGICLIGSFLNNSIPEKKKEFCKLHKWFYTEEKPGIPSIMKCSKCGFCPQGCDEFGRLNED